MDRRVFWLRASYWTGAIAVLVAALQVVILGLFPFEENGDSHTSLYALGSFLLGWSLLLTWSGRKPEERKGVLLLTLCPVLTSGMAAEIYALVFTALFFTARLVLWIFQWGLSLLFAFSYLQARRTYPKWWSQRA